MGSYITKELQNNGYFFKVVARNIEKLKKKGIEASEVLQAELTIPDAIRGACEGIDVAISTVDITRQKDGLTYMDVDYQANMNLLEEARRSGVQKVIYVSVLNGDKLRHLKVCDAKERFVEQLKLSGLDYCIVRPNGFFSDMSELFKMAKKGRVYLFGNGELRANPIHGKELAVICMNAIERADKEIDVGGPEILTRNEIAKTAFEVLGKKPKITYIPDWVRVVTLKVVRLFPGSKTYGPIEFFMTVLAMDMVAPEYGRHTLKEYFTKLNSATGKYVRDNFRLYA